MQGNKKSESLITRVSHPAMATDFAVLLPERWSDRVEIALAALENLDLMERRLTIYRDDGEIAQVNQFAAERPVHLSSATFELIEKAMEWSERTAGAFDITAGPLVEVWGFTTRSGKKPTETEIKDALSKVGFRLIGLSAADRSIQFGCPEMSINLGAIGKGDALDRIAAELVQSGITDFLIHGGNSSVIAAGDQEPGSGTGWAVGISHPTKPKRRLGGIWLKDMALATSGSGKQFFHHRGKRYGHVIDPRTGYPAGDLLALTVTMKSAADADACATGLFVMGSDEMEKVANQDWFPPLVTVKQGSRQDEVEWESRGEIAWVET